MNNSDERGFTLVEIIIILPIVTFLIVVVIVLAQTTYYRILANNAETNMRLEGQVLLSQLQDQLLFATDFGETKSSDLVDAHAPAGGWNSESDPETLIIYETSLTGGRRDPDRQFVYKETYNCNSNNAQYNPIAVDNVIYFAVPNENNNYYSLYRRILTPQYATCNTNYREQTCPTESDIGSNYCEATDSLLSDHLVDLDVEYYDQDNALIDTTGTGSPLDGEKVRVTVTLGNVLYGNPVEVSSSLTMKKIN
jgi:type II secretory pathway pseudopilin PulG